MEQGSLRERKQQRSREAIIEAAHALFEEHGFDKVTVADISERAQVGRATFFRYFGDKQEVVFSDGGDLEAVLTEAGQITREQPIGNSLPAALEVARRIVVSYVRRIIAEPAGYTRHERLVASHPELLARSLTKQRRYAELLRDLLAGQGASREIAAIAAEMGLAAYYAGRALVGDDPARLPAAVESVFDRLSQPRV
ncbi:TetR/AcrR family transcriptional regulator [Nonomuraea sp. 3N208]|uniref:TetR/AcrR family transcriptional regulator n=1 Tax=Nonomuraea sp. 3N208 TaxID=3457421 RepID=UPI003FCD2E7B